MAYQPISGIEAAEGGAGSGVLPAGAYVAVITDAAISKSKKGEIALLLTWDVADGEHAGHFAGSMYGHTEWLMLEGKGAPYAAARLDKVTASNSMPPVTFDARALADRYAVAFDTGGRMGQMSVPEFAGRFVGLVVGTQDEVYNGKVQHRNYVDRWITPDEVKAGRYVDSKGAVHEVKTPTHRDNTKAAQPAAPAYQQPAAAAPQAYTQPVYQAPTYSAPQVADSDIPF